MTDYVNDTFTDADGTLIPAHTGEIGASWTREYLGSDANWEIFGNALREKDFSGGLGSRYIHASGVPLTRNYTVEAQLLYAGVGGLIEFALNARGYTVPDDGFGSPTPDAIEGYIAISGSSSAQVYGRWSGGGSSATPTLSNADGFHTIKLVCAEDVASLYYDSVLVVSGTVTGVVAMLAPDGFIDPGWVGMAINASAYSGIGAVTVLSFRAYPTPPSFFWTDYVVATETDE